MNTKQIKLSIIATTVALTSFFVRPVFADGCTTQYGGYSAPCPSTDLSINKQVKNPATGVFVENLGVTDAAFGADSKVTYKLLVTNSSNDTFAEVTIKDVIPEYLTFIAGPGTYDVPSRTLTIIEKDLKSGETRSLEFVAQVVPKDKLPDTSFFCVTNKASVSANDRYDEDTADGCIQKDISGKSTLPVAGFNDIALMIPFAATGLTGLTFLIKRKK
jgi:uncharacterized repeat protein (TIGR01451 family)